MMNERTRRPRSVSMWWKHASVICTLGDLLLDVVVVLDGPIAEDTDTYGRTRVGPGGQAANVAAWIAAFGGRSRFVGKRARDPAGRMLADELRARGVDLVGPEVEAGTGTVVSLALRDGTRTMLTDRGVSPDFRPEELEPRWLDGCEHLHVPGYSLVADPLRATALAGAERAPRVSIDLSSTAAIRAAGVEAFRAVLERARPAIVFANAAEAELVGEISAPTVVVKLGARGCAVRSAGVETRYDAVPAEVVDTTGAGDAFAAGFLVGGPELALEAAARCVSRAGAFPDG
jgi:ribokinase